MKQKRIVPDNSSLPRSSRGGWGRRSATIRACRWAFGLGAAVLASVSLLGCDKQPPPPPPPPEVGIITVQPQPVVLTTELPGRIAAYRIAEIRPQVSGLIEKRLFVEGSDVKAGDVLYEISSASFKAALDSALAALSRSEAHVPALQARVARFRDLVPEKAVSQQDLDDAMSALKQTEADVQSWKANVEAARINLAYTRMTSPISGRIGKSAVTDGAIVTAYQPLALAAVQQLDPIYVDVPQSTAELLRLKGRLANGRLTRRSTNHNSVQLILEDGTRYPLKGTLQFQDISVDASTGSVILRMVFPNPDGILLPGMFVRALVEEGANEKAIMVPQQSVMRSPKGDPLVLVVDSEGKAQQRILVTDRAIGDQWLVSSGLVPGECLIVEGLQRVRPGTPVKAATMSSEGQPAEPSGKAPRPATKGK